jgi:predicted transcriptional regulator
MALKDGRVQRNSAGLVKRGSEEHRLQARQVLERIAEALSQTTAEVRSYIKQQPEFAEVGQRMLQEWEKGAALSLRSA